MNAQKISDPENFEFASVVIKDSKSTLASTQLESHPTADC
jgi:hypothetical protein